MHQSLKRSIKIEKSGQNVLYCLDVRIESPNAELIDEIKASVYDVLANEGLAQSEETQEGEKEEKPSVLGFHVEHGEEEDEEDEEGDE